MDSLVFYDAACNRYAVKKNGTARERRADFEKLVELILKELDEGAGGVKASPFLAETDRVYGAFRKSGKASMGQLRRRRPNLTDACEVAACVFRCLHGGDGTAPGDAKAALFAGSWPESGLERRFAGLQKNMDGIKNCLKEKNIGKKESVGGAGAEAGRPGAERERPGARGEGSGAEAGKPAVERAGQERAVAQTGKPDAERAGQERAVAQTGKPDAERAGQERAAAQAGRPGVERERQGTQKESSGVEAGRSGVREEGAAQLCLRAERECTERRRMRLEANRREAREWHESQRELIGTMAALQGDIGRELKRLMRYSDDLTENYILRFARAMTEIYNLISDGYLFHKERAEREKNEDYYNAVLNYEEFMSSIADALSGFGVEEIVSERGTAFDGKIHAVCDGSGDFSARSAVVERSVRPGFRYHDIVLQKERIQL